MQDIIKQKYFLTSIWSAMLCKRCSLLWRRANRIDWSEQRGTCEFWGENRQVL